MQIDVAGPGVFTEAPARCLCWFRDNFGILEGAEILSRAPAR
jgi:hypothetical protein